MSAESTPVYRFGDLLALARQSWVTQMSLALEAAGFPGYRRSDAAVVRLLRRRPLAVGHVGDALGVTRQAGRKVVAGLEQRGLVQLHRDDRDGRQLNVALTAQGEAYARAIIAVIDNLGHALAERVTAEQLVAADFVLRAVLADERSRAVAARLPLPPGG